jgi:replication factor C subunit 3/5
MDNIPLVEKWRPSNFDKIVLDPLNKKILQNIIDTGKFPNMLFYGPPGTGKTTSIINLINSYQMNHCGKINKSLVIHLNASDERGVEIIRVQINQFVNSKTLFEHGLKFVILDEVDYITKNAQQALCYLIQEYSHNVRFCLICNYISRIDEGLQNEFIKLKFNQLPKEDIIDFLYNISNVEKLGYTRENIELIQQIYKSDIRNMINYMQSNRNINSIKNNIINIAIWEELFQLYKSKAHIAEIKNFIEMLSSDYNYDKKHIIKDFLSFIIRNKPEYISCEFLSFAEQIIHNMDCKLTYYLNFAIIGLCDFICV